MATTIEELMLFNRLKETIVVFGKKIEWHTLDGDEFTGALQSTPAFDDFTRVQLLKKEKLARAIDSIDGHTWLELIPEDKRKEVTPLMKARELIGKWQKDVINYIYHKYELLEQRSNQALEDYEKDFQSSPQKSA